MSVPAQDLRSIVLFAGFDDAELDIIRQVVVARDYPARSTVFVQGDPSPGLWFVQRGRVRIYRISPSGRELTLCTARPDRLPCLGACPLFSGEVCPANAQALEPTTVFFLERDRALDLAGHYSGMARLLARVLSNHFRHLTRLSTGLALHCSTSRLVDLLLSYAGESGRATARGIELDLDLSQDHLASTLGMTRQMLAQDLLRLEQAGALDAQGKHIVILDPQRLYGLSQPNVTYLLGS